MTLATEADTQQADVQLTLSRPDADLLRTIVPWLLRGLADRPTAPLRQRERRGQARAALERLLAGLSSQLPPADENRTSQ
jgi:hypothetical protein